MAISLVTGEVESINGLIGEQKLTLTSISPVSGNLLVAIYSCRANTYEPIADDILSSSDGATYNKAWTRVVGAAGPTCGGAMFYRISDGTEVDIKFGIGGDGGNNSLIVAHFEGNAASSVLDDGAIDSSDANASVTSIDTGSATASGDGAAICGVAPDDVNEWDYDTISFTNATHIPDGTTNSPVMGIFTYTGTGTKSDTISTTDVGGPGHGVIGLFLEPATGGLNVNLGAISSGNSLHTLSLSPGAVDVSPGHIASGNTLHALSLSSSIDVALEHIASANQLHALSLSPGAVDISLGYIAAGSTLYQLTPSAGGIPPQDISLGYVVSGNVLYPVSAAPGAVDLALAHLVSGHQVFAPTLSPGAVDIGLQHLAAGSQLYTLSLAVSGGLQDIALGVISAGSTLHTLNLTPGAVDILLAHLSSGNQVYALTASPGAVDISLGHVVSGNQLYALTLTHSGQIFMSYIPTGHAVHSVELTRSTDNFNLQNSEQFGRYTPIPLPFQQEEELARAVYGELARIADTLSEPNMQSFILLPLTAEPSRIYEGMVVRADGTNWDPGSGAGLYYFLEGTWNLLG